MFSKIVSSVSSALDFNLATLSGCIDILVVPKANGELQSTPFHVRFGKAKLLRSREKIVSVSVNWQQTDLRMQLGAAGEAYFLVQEADSDDTGSLASDTLDEDQEVHHGSPKIANEPYPSIQLSDIPDVIDFTGMPSSDKQFQKENSNFGANQTRDSSFQTETDGEQISLVRHNVDQSLRLDSLQYSSQDNNTNPFTSYEGFTRPVRMPPSTMPASSSLAPQNVMEGNHLLTTPPRVELSLCGHLLYGTANEAFHDRDVFQANLATWDTLDLDPSVWYHPSLVARFDQRPPYFPAKAVFPLIMSWVVYGRPIGPEALQSLLNCSVDAVVPKPSPMAAVPFSRKFSQSFSTKRRTQSVDSKKSRARKQSEPLSDYNEKGLTSRHVRIEETPVPGDQRQSQYLCSCNPRLSAESETRFGQVDEVSKNEPVSHSAVLRLAVPGETLPTSTSVWSTSASPALAGPSGRVRVHGRTIKYRKSLRPTNKQLMSLNLKPGPNSITFSVTSALQGTKSITGTIYLWPRNAKIVVSDVDGTITRSDVWGQLMPIVGRDWSHAGVAELFSNVRKNGYRILYLTARAIGQADSTRDYLFGLTQNEKNKLPDGPLILSPDRLFPSFKREVIDRKPYVFKIAALRDIRNLFPPFYNPFYAGFGNRDSDHRAYVHIGVPEAKIFIIDPLGVVHHVNSTYAKSYESMTEISAEMFPAINEETANQHVDDQVKLNARENAIRELKRTLLRSKGILSPPEGVFSPPAKSRPTRQQAKISSARGTSLTRPCVPFMCWDQTVTVENEQNEIELEMLPTDTTAPGIHVEGVDTSSPDVSPRHASIMAERQRNFMVPGDGLQNFMQFVSENDIDEDRARAVWPLRKHFSLLANPDISGGESPPVSRPARPRVRTTGDDDISSADIVKRLLDFEHKTIDGSQSPIKKKSGGETEKAGNGMLRLPISRNNNVSQNIVVSNSAPFPTAHTPSTTRIRAVRPSAESRN